MINWDVVGKPQHALITKQEEEILESVLATYNLDISDPKNVLHAIEEELNSSQMVTDLKREFTCRKLCKEL